MPAKRVSAKCSKCGRTFRADSRGLLLDKIRKHMWKQHADWMRGRIKSGLRKSSKAQANLASKRYHSPGNPFGETLKKILNPSWTGFAERPVIERITGRPYEQVRQEAVDAFVAQLFDNIK
jgi:hypothetical protein